MDSLASYQDVARRLDDPLPSSSGHSVEEEEEGIMGSPPSYQNATPLMDPPLPSTASRHEEESMDVLPSYQDATKRLDWLVLVAPYVRVRDYARLCRVSRRFYSHFAPRLWNDPVQVARSLGICRDDGGTEWYCYWLLGSYSRTRDTTKRFVGSLDLRGFALDAVDFSVNRNGGNLQSSLRSLPQIYPWLRCIVLDGHPELSPAIFATPAFSGLPDPPTFEYPLLLSVPRRQTELPLSFYKSPYLKDLVYLDVSAIPGSLRGPLEAATLSPLTLPNLRILKAQERELDGMTATTLFESFKNQLWSLDMSRNNLGDAIIGPLCAFCFHHGSSLRRHTKHRFAVEGWMSLPPPGRLVDEYRGFRLVRESEWSATFSHPDRYLVDAPAYERLNTQGMVTDDVRLDGKKKILNDSLDAVKATLTQRRVFDVPLPTEANNDNLPGYSIPPRLRMNQLDICKTQKGITHLYLNENKISAQGVENIMLSTGQLQHFECDTMSLKVPPKAFPSWMARWSMMSGILGQAYLFRPMVASNLQVLRIHHSLVTNLPTLEADTLGAMTNIWLAETFLLPRADLVYPQVFVPDMNPRLRSLTLSHIPRYSTGPLIERLINFLKLASAQERAIQDTGLSRSRKPVTVSGLSHIRLEFDPDPRDEIVLSAINRQISLNLQDLDNLKVKEFSFFGESDRGRWESSTSPSSPSPLSHPTFPTRQPGTPSSATFSSAAAADAVKRHPNSRTATISSTRTTTRYEFMGQSDRLDSAASADPVPDPDPETTAATTTTTSSSPAESSSPTADTSTRPDLKGKGKAMPTEGRHVVPNHFRTGGSKNLFLKHPPADEMEFTAPLWTGPGPHDPPIHRTPATEKYAAYPWHELRRKPEVIPATPCHVAAGVPPGSYVSSRAWDSMFWDGLAGAPEEGGMRRPTAQDLGSMRPVLDAIKKYRKGTRAAYEEMTRRWLDQGNGGKEVPLGEPHWHWSGKLEVSTENTEGRWLDSRYWR